MRRPLLIAILLCLSIPAAIAEPPSAQGEIRVALERWTSDFNAGQSDKVCGLFAGFPVQGGSRRPRQGRGEAHLDDDDADQVGGAIETTEDEGLDVFRRSTDGR
jgi:hypothetical protein